MMSLLVAEKILNHLKYKQLLFCLRSRVTVFVGKTHPSGQSDIVTILEWHYPRYCSDIADML